MARKNMMMTSDYKQIALIVAIDSNFGFGKQGKIPWHSKKDFEHFKKVTNGASCVMGRKTYEDMLTYKKKLPEGGELLPNRETIVVSNSLEEAYGSKVATSIDDAIKECTRDRIFFLGGLKIFESAIRNYATEAYVTVMKNDYNCDTTFPAFEFITNFNFKEYIVKDAGMDILHYIRKDFGDEK
jgi:dihydrofolate reductase